MQFNQLTFSTYLSTFLSRLQIERNLSTYTIAAYKSDLHCLIQWFHTSHLDDFNQTTLLAYFTWLQHTRRLHPKSIHRKYVSIHQFCSYLNQENFSDERFFCFNSRRFIIPKNLPKTLSTSELRALITETENEYYRLNSDFRRLICLRDMVIIEFLFCLGLRIGEVHQLHLDDYNAENQSILINGKGRKERLLFISSPVVIKKLNTWLTIRSNLSPTSNSMFINKYGDTLSIFGIENIFKKYRDLAQINPHSTPHYLRHTFASCLLSNGASIRDVQELLGHNSIVTTQIYTEISLNRKKSVLMQFNERNFLFSNQ